MASMVRECLTGSDSKKKISAMRVSVLLTVFSIMGTFIAHNVFAMIAGKGIVSLGWNEVVVLTTVLGAKAFQHTSEAKSNATTASSGSMVNPTADEDADMAKG